MRPRAIAELNRLKDEDLFEAISEGLGYLADHCARLADATSTLADHRRGRGQRVLQVICAEEAAKYLILLDVVRMPRQPQGQRANQLKRFNEHLSKGIYAQVCDYRPVDFAEVEDGVSHLRRSLYLDGPQDVDWIFRNRIVDDRERALYIDYVESDLGCHWSLPFAVHDDAAMSQLYVEPTVVSLIRAMHRLGLGTAESLAKISRRWRQIRPTADMTYTQLRAEIFGTLSVCSTKGEEEDQRLVLRAWPFPLWSLDLSPISVDRADLERKRIETWAREFDS